VPRCLGARQASSKEALHRSDHLKLTLVIDLPLEAGPLLDQFYDIRLVLEFIVENVKGLLSIRIELNKGLPYS
jgi:hypothetical protein